MKRGWFERNFGWIRDDFHSLVEDLKKPDTWVGIGLVTLFFGLAIYVFRVALRSDTMLRALHPGITAICRELGENAIAFLFFGMIFFGLTALATLGEFVSFLDSKRRRDEYGRSQALRGLAGWGFVALAIGLAAAIFLDSRCY